MRVTVMFRERRTGDGMPPHDLAAKSAKHDDWAAVEYTFGSGP